jgi:predicted acylesterase/phospholipase RssA
MPHAPHASRPRAGALLLVVVVLSAAGCTHANRPLNPADVQLEARGRNRTLAALDAGLTPTFRATPSAQADASRVVRADAAGGAQAPADARDDGCFVGLALSGGGSRSANFSAGCMLQLQRLGLMGRVDYISAVSGGSITAALYCLADDAHWNPQLVQKRLTHAFATDLWMQTVAPWNSFALFFSDFDRSDLLAGSFNRHLFHDAAGRTQTFADLRADRPRLLINATDLQSGRKFIFCNEAFDELNSDLAAYPIANAVAASSAVPVLLHHVTLRDYSTVFKQYRHLIDGGIVDNLGVQSLVETYAAHVEAARRAGRANPYPRGAVLLVLDARTEFDAKLSDKGDVGLVESIVMGTGLTSTALLNRASSATLSEIIVRYAADRTTAKELRAHIDRLTSTGDLSVTDRNGTPVRVMHLALSRVKDLGNLPHSSFRESVNGIQTYFNISSTEAFNLYKAAELLVSEKFEPELTKILEDLSDPAAVPAGKDPNADE